MSEKLFERARKIGSHIQAPSLTVLLRDMIKEIERLNEVERQRDQLLAALKAAMRFIDSHVADPDITPEMTAAWLDLLKINPENLIAAVEGGNQS